MSHPSTDPLKDARPPRVEFGADGGMPGRRATLAREEAAEIEIGHTELTRPMALALLVLCLATIFAEPVVQHVCEISAYGPMTSSGSTATGSWNKSRRP
jgi:hypothetical protein